MLGVAGVVIPLEALHFFHFHFMARTESIIASDDPTAILF
jgi:hypothetical protein